MFAADRIILSVVNALQKSQLETTQLQHMYALQSRGPDSHMGRESGQIPIIISFQTRQQLLEACGCLF